MTTAKTLCVLRCASCMFAFLFAAGTAHSESHKAPSSFSDWWNGKYATGDWFGARDTLEERGIELSGQWVSVYYGIVDSERGARGFFDQEIEFGGSLDFSKLTDVDGLRGLKGFGKVRYRQGINPNNFALASDNFQPSYMQSGLQWRILSFGLTYTTPELFGIKNFLTFTGGWLQPQLEFILQPLSKQFVNAAFESSKGIGANIPYSSSFSTWGGVLTVRPTNWYFAKGALFMAYPQAPLSENHGLAFEGFAADPSTNRLMAMFETGFTPKISAAELPGKYVFGSYWCGQSNDSYNGESYPGFYGFYWQVDQMLYREPAATPSFSKDGKAAREKSTLNEQGLHTLNLLTFSPAYNQPLAFYFHSGLVYRGLIPTRDNDQLMAAFGYGNYSYNNIQSLQSAGNVNQPNYTGVLEVDYRVQINPWMYFQPYIQYIMRPNGSDAIQNATILGFMTGVIF